jgi:hypothetical protein
MEPGGIVRVSAEGATAPPFDAEIKMAANVVFDGPNVLALDANAAEDIPVRWTTEGDNDEVFLDLGIGDTSVTCWFDSKAGIGTVPAAFVSELLADGGSCDDSPCVMFLASKRSRTMNAGDWTMVLAHGFATVRDVRVTR